MFSLKVHSFDRDGRDFLFLSPSVIQSVDEHNALHLQLSPEYLIAGGYEGYSRSDPGYRICQTSILIWDRISLNFSRKISLFSDLDAMKIFANLLITVQRVGAPFPCTSICVRDLRSASTKKIFTYMYGQSKYRRVYAYGQIIRAMAFNGNTLLVGGGGIPNPNFNGWKKKLNCYTFGPRKISSFLPSLPKLRRRPS